MTQGADEPPEPPESREPPEPERPVSMPDDDHLYWARDWADGGVPLTIPYRQGDVFREIDAADFGTRERDEGLAMLFMHPCTMRDGVKLRERVTLVPVYKFGKGSSRDADRWEAGNFSEIPLRQLRKRGRIHVADMSTMATVDAAHIPRGRRVASLADDGVIAVQHRLIFHLTRLSISYGELRAANRALLAELDMQRAWAELTVQAASDESLACVEEAEERFDEFLAVNDRRDRLRDAAVGEPAVRREFHEVCQKVFNQLPG